MKTNPNEPINPTKGYDNEFKNTNLGGLTKREYFAGLAMQGLCANSELAIDKAENIARGAVEQADALINELNKEESK